MIIKDFDRFLAFVNVHELHNEWYRKVHLKRGIILHNGQIVHKGETKKGE